MLKVDGLGNIFSASGSEISVGEGCNGGREMATGLGTVELFIIVLSAHALGLKQIAIKG